MHKQTQISGTKTNGYTFTRKYCR